MSFDLIISLLGQLLRDLLVQRRVGILAEVFVEDSHGHTLLAGLQQSVLGRKLVLLHFRSQLHVQQVTSDGINELQIRQFLT